MNENRMQDEVANEPRISGILGRHGFVGAAAVIRRTQKAFPASAPLATGVLALAAGTALLFCIDVLFAPVAPHVSVTFQRFATPLVFFCAAALCLIKGRASLDERAAWFVFALALVLWGSAELYYGLFLVDMAEVPVPSPADGLWLAFYPPAYAALYLLLRKRVSAVGKRVWLDAIIGALGVGGASAVLVFGVALDSTSGPVVAVVTNLAYPVGDMGLVAVVAVAVTVMGWKRSGAWRWIAGAFTLLAVVDGLWLVEGAAGSYTPGGILDLGWPAVGLMIGLAATRVTPRTLSRPTEASSTGIVMPAMVGFAALLLLLTNDFVPTNPLALGLAAAAIAALLIRLCVTVRDNALLLEQSRREATTDALTGLGNRRQLTRDLAEHLDDLDPEHPLMLTLFDLDGFKEYNDLFGHPAGDQLLQRISTRLRDLLAGRGGAYRMGGDEFCALWHESDTGQASVTTMEAAAALSESGKAFSIGCSYGSVLLPNETTDPTEALRTADRRMYTRKGKGRVSAAQQSADVLQRALVESDSKLSAHLGEVADLVSATAVGLGVPREELDTARQAGLLHDVGKVAIPDEILSKPGPLDNSEWAFMKRHTLIGERIISAAPALMRVAKCVRSTHERYDGGGYPDGLAGDAIPLIARIVAVCDAYDAMVTKRVYRGARDSAAAITELRDCSGTQFDPDVVDAFVIALRLAEAHRPATAERRPAAVGSPAPA